MDCKFMRLKTYLDEGSAQDEKEKIKLRFVRNLKYCDLYARKEDECKEWINRLGQAMIRTDFHEKFKVKKILGEGSFAKVYLAINLEDEKMFAVKAFSKDKLSKQSKGKAALKNEVEILSELNCSNIMHMYEVHESKNSLYLVCEYLNGGSLNDFLKNSEDYLTTDQVLNVIL
jgi:calcium/calmodulin-dependent protein kinase I